MADPTPTPTGKDIYAGLVTVTATLATVIAALTNWTPEPQRSYLVAAGVLIAALHGVLIDPKLIAALGTLGGKK